MRKLVLKILLVALPFLALVAAFELKYKPRNNSRYAAKKQLLQAALPATEILILGSSHGLHAFQPEFISGKAFNLANPGQTIYYDVKLAGKTIPQMPALKAVVLPVSYQSLWTMLDQGVENWRCYYYRYYFGIEHHDRHMADDVRNFSLYFLYGRKGGMFLTNREFEEDVSNWFTPQGGFNIALGAAHPALHKVTIPMEQSAIERLPDGSPKENEENFTENLALIESLARSLQQRNIPLILTTTPGTKPYVQRMKPALRERLRVAMTTLEKIPGVKYRDYLEDSRFSNDDFLDADHLAPEGAKKFSKIFASEMIAPAMR